MQLIHHFGPLTGILPLSMYANERPQRNLERVAGKASQILYSSFLKVARSIICKIPNFVCKPAACINDLISVRVGKGREAP